MGKPPILLLTIAVSARFVKSFAKLFCPDMRIALSGSQRRFERSLPFLRVLTRQITVLRLYVLL